MSLAIAENKAVSDKGKNLTVLTVEDDRLEQAFLKSRIKELGYDVVQVMDAGNALDILMSEQQIDIILMDRIMPGIDGIAAVHKIKQNKKFEKIPIIMVTGADSAEEIQQGIEAGVFYYLNKPANEKLLKSVLIAAAAEVKKNSFLFDESKKRNNGLSLIEYCKFTFKTVEEAKDLAGFCAGCFPQPERAYRGLFELMVNAVEHGSLGISYEEKTRLIEKSEWEDEISLRQGLEENKNKTVTAILSRKKEGVYIVITDEGRGFNWKKFISIDPSRAGDSHGRGIAQAKNACFDRLAYNEKGNQVIGFIGYDEKLKW